MTLNLLDFLGTVCWKSPSFFILANMLSSAQLAVQMFPYRYPLEDIHGQSTPWTSIQVHCHPIVLYALAPSSTFPWMLRRMAQMALNGLSELRSWYVIYRGSTLLRVLHIFFPRKMCTRCSVPPHRLLGLLNCILRLVDHISKTHSYLVTTFPTC